MVKQLLFLLGLSLMIACKKDKPADNNATIPVLATEAVSEITQTTATAGGGITSDGGALVSARGVCWSMLQNPTVSDGHTSDGSGIGNFVSHLAGLTPNTPYYARAYATNSAGTAYGNQQSFITLQLVLDTVSDIDGNIYHVIEIGTQHWFMENLKVTHYRNGDAIPMVTADIQWKTLTTGAFCHYDNNPSNTTLYGELYNLYAITDARNICPQGWHIPADTEWTTLCEFLGGKSIAGGKMKSTGTIEQDNGLWYSPNTGATNSSGFTALPGGYRINYGNFYSLGNVAYFWSSTDTLSLNSWNYILDANNENLNRNFNLKTNGFSVRCCKDGK